MASVAMDAPEPQLGLAEAWRRSLGWLLLCAAGIMALLWRDALAMAAIWWNSSTFNHCLLIIPILGWLVQQRRGALALMMPHAWWPGLLWGAMGALLWLFGQAAGVALFKQAALIILLQSSVISLLGPHVAKALLFPLFFSLFLIPFGEELVPPLQTLTAELAMFLLGLSGIPAHISGIFISTPNGYFEVAEACSGAKFLIAMAAYSVLAAHVCFRSAQRRAWFLAGALITPVIANGLRAFGTIWVAEHYGRDTATGFDHVIYGWVFFAVVIALVMAVAWRWFDRSPHDPFIEPGSIRAPAFARSVRPGHVSATLAALLLLPFGWALWVDQSQTGRTAEIRLPAIAGWTETRPDWQAPWAPNFEGADAIRMVHLRNQAGKMVDLAIVAFASQRDGKEIVGFGQGAITPGGAWAWSSNGPRVKGGQWEMIAAPGPVHRQVVSFYRIGGTLTGQPAKVKLETLKARLTGGDQRAIAVMISAEDRTGATAEAALRAFLGDAGDMALLADRAVIVR